MKKIFALFGISILLYSCGKETLSTTSIMFYFDQTHTIEIFKGKKVLSNNDFLFSSADASVATVNSEGVVSGISIGTTEVEVMGDDFSAICKVTVKPYIDELYRYPPCYWGKSMEYMKEELKERPSLTQPDPHTLQCEGVDEWDKNQQYTFQDDALSLIKYELKESDYLNLYFPVFLKERYEFLYDNGIDFFFRNRKNGDIITYRYIASNYVVQYEPANDFPY